MAKEIKNVEYGLEKIFEGAQDFLPLLGTDYVEFYVGNAKQSAHFYKTAFGFQSYAYAGLETGLKDRTSYVLKQDKIRIVLTTALNSDSPIGEHVKKHGDGVKVIALWVEDARKAFEETTKRGAKPFMEPTVEKFVPEFIPTEKLFTCLLNVKIIKVNFCRALKHGKAIITLLLLV